VELRLLYLNGPDLYRLDTNEGQLNAMEKQVKALWAAIERAIERDQFPPRTSRLCDYCSFKDICPAWQTADTELELAASATSG
jgi:putative RecB family exonuclease